MSPVVFVDILQPKKIVRILDVHHFHTSPNKDLMTDTPPHPVHPPPDSPSDHFCANTVSFDVVPLEGLRNNIQTLSNSDKLDKESALHMTRLFHAMELLMTHEINIRDARIASLQHDIQEQRLRVEFDRIATRHIQEDAMMASTPHGTNARGLKRGSR